MKDPPSEKGIATILCQLRREYGYKQKEVSEGTGISCSQLSNIEQRITRRPRRETLQKLANFFGVPLPRIEGKHTVWFFPEVSE